MGYVIGPKNPELYPLRSDDSELTELMCDVEAPTMLDAIAQVARNIQLIPGLYAVGVRQGDKVTLADAAQRCRRDRESLVSFSQKRGFPEPLCESGKTKLYSWTKIAEFLHEIGGVPLVPQEIKVADLMLRLAVELKALDIPEGTLRSFGLPRS